MSFKAKQEFLIKLDSCIIKKENSIKAWSINSNISQN